MIKPVTNGLGMRLTVQDLAALTVIMSAIIGLAGFVNNLMIERKIVAMKSELTTELIGGLSKLELRVVVVERKQDQQEAKGK